MDRGTKNNKRGETLGRIHEGDQEKEVKQCFEEKRTFLSEILTVSGRGTREASGAVSTDWYLSVLTHPGERSSGRRNQTAVD